MKKVIVEWVDSNVLHGWQMEGEVSCDIAVCESLGYVKYEDNDKLILSQTVSNFGSQMGVLAIPKGCIKSVKELRAK